ncbi:hypothetical protein [Bacteroides finegoldii]|uniref:fimbrillin family protein n=1 Tax=Bacteroides finegoldii TaxID=338188 RepID=UPI001E2AF75B|nr:hypothetical protein [Bacteroides finegoldii]
MMKKGQITYKRIKQYLLIGFCSILLFNCSRDTYVGELPTDDDAPLVEPVPIVLSLGMSDFDILTRGSGEVNNGNDADFWNQVRFYVYAFNKDPQTDLSKPWSATNEDFCLLDGSRTGGVNAQVSNHGKEVGVKKEDSNLMLFYPDEESQSIYYNMRHTDWPYNFFAYYLDDYVSECHREKDYIYYDIELDGRRDFMSSMANIDKQEDKYEGNPYKDKILGRAYSAYSANHGLNPVFQFEHHLVLLRFVVCKPDNSPNEDKDEKKNIPPLDPSLTVKKIEVNSKYKGRFIVAVNDPTDQTKPQRGISFNNEEYKYIELRKKNGELIGSDGWCVVAKCPVYGDERDHLYVLDKDIDNERDTGTSLLVAPADFYEAKISLSAENGLQGSLYTEVDVKLENDEVFSAGKAYTIYLTVNSLSDITPKVTMGMWEDGGSGTINPNDKFEDEM